MWTPIKTTQNLMVAEAWKELFEEEGIPCTLHWPEARRRYTAQATCYVLVPNDRLHVAERTVSNT
ncbi:MAG: hypothetical protein HY675_15325 [Chloroflexi bacterium]|nr:hypothetical protein [Chloroflexota bacterium]